MNWFDKARLGLRYLAGNYFVFKVWPASDSFPEGIDDPDPEASGAVHERLIGITKSNARNGVGNFRGLKWQPIITGLTDWRNATDIVQFDFCMARYDVRLLPRLSTSIGFLANQHWVFPTGEEYLARSDPLHPTVQVHQWPLDEFYVNHVLRYFETPKYPVGGSVFRWVDSGSNDRADIIMVIATADVPRRYMTQIELWSTPLPSGTSSIPAPSWTIHDTHVFTNSVPCSLFAFDLAGDNAVALILDEVANTVQEFDANISIVADAVTGSIVPGALRSYSETITISDIANRTQYTDVSPDESFSLTEPYTEFYHSPSRTRSVSYSGTFVLFRDWYGANISTLEIDLSGGSSWARVENYNNITAIASFWDYYTEYDRTDTISGESQRLAVYWDNGTSRILLAEQFHTITTRVYNYVSTTGTNEWFELDNKPSGDPQPPNQWVIPPLPDTISLSFPGNPYNRVWILYCDLRRGVVVMCQLSGDYTYSVTRTPPDPVVHTDRLPHLATVAYEMWVDGVKTTLFSESFTMPNNAAVVADLTDSLVAANPVQAKSLSAGLSEAQWSAGGDPTTFDGSNVSNNFDVVEYVGPLDAGSFQHIEDENGDLLFCASIRLFEFGPNTEGWLNVVRQGNLDTMTDITGDEPRFFPIQVVDHLGDFAGKPFGT